MKKALKHLPTIVLLAFIFLMAILFFSLPKKEYSSSEKRYLSDFPTLTVDTFFSGDFGEEFEKYLSDHTPFRNFWVGLNSYYNLALGNPLSNGIYHCSDGYLINDPPNTDRLDINIDVISEFADKSGLPATMILAPSTGYVASDVLPNEHIVYNDDELFADVTDTLSKSTVNFVDIREDFKNAYKNGTQVYYKTDHHWTSEGAYLAYCALSDELGFTANTKEMYDITTHSGFYGTTSHHLATGSQSLTILKCGIVKITAVRSASTITEQLKLIIRCSLMTTSRKTTNTLSTLTATTRTQ